MELFVTKIGNGWKLLTVVTESFILNVTGLMVGTLPPSFFHKKGELVKWGVFEKRRVPLLTY